MSTTSRLTSGLYTITSHTGSHHIGPNLAPQNAQALEELTPVVRLPDEMLPTKVSSVKICRHRVCSEAFVQWNLQASTDPTESTYLISTADGDPVVERDGLLWTKCSGLQGAHIEEWIVRRPSEAGVQNAFT